MIAIVALARFVLPNGIAVVLDPDPGAASVVVHARYGTDDDPRAAIVEHLMFRGSTHVADFEGTIDRAGGWANVVRTFDHTSCITAVPPGALALALQLEAERMVGLTIDAPRIDRARAEIAIDPIAAALDPIATPIAAPNPTDVAAYHRAHFAPASLTLVVAGRFDEQAARKLIERDFGWMPSAKVVPSAKVEPPSAERKPQHEPKPERTPLDGPRDLAIPMGIPRTIHAYRAPAAGRDARALDAFAVILERRGARASRDERIFTIEGSVSSATLVPPTDEELASAHAILEARLVEALENPTFRADLAARGSTLEREQRELLVTPSEIGDAARRWLAESAALTVRPR